MATLESTIADLVEAAAQRAFDRLVERLDRLEALAAKREPARLLYSEVEAAKALGISALSLKKWRCRGLVNAYTSVKPIQYRWQDIEAVAAWMAEGGPR